MRCGKEFNSPFRFSVGYVCRLHCTCTCRDAIIKHDVNIRSTFFMFGGGVNYRSQWQYRLSSSFTCFRSILYLFFRWFLRENSTLGLQNEPCYTHVRYCCQEIQRAENFIWFLQTVTVLQLYPWILAWFSLRALLTQCSLHSHTDRSTSCVCRCCMYETGTSSAKMWLHRLPTYRRLWLLSACAYDPKR